MSTQKRDRFVKIVEARTNKILKMIRLLANCSNRQSYEYSSEDVKKIFSTIEKEIKTARAKFEETDGTRFKLN